MLQLLVSKVPKRQLNFLGVGNLFLRPLLTDLSYYRAYIVHALPESVKSEADKARFSENVKKWIQTKVARHKYLRGGKLLSWIFSQAIALRNLFNPTGVVVIDVIPKR